MQNGKVAARVEGADAAALSAAVAEHIAAAEPRAALPPASTAAAPAVAAAGPATAGLGSTAATSDCKQGVSATARIRQLLASSPVMLFMKARCAACRGFLTVYMCALRWVDIIDTMYIIHHTLHANTDKGCAAFNFCHGTHPCRCLGANALYKPSRKNSAPFIAYFP